MLRSICSGLFLISHAQALQQPESFEAEIPAHISATGGKLSPTTDHLVDGGKSLRWDFKDGDAFVIQTGPLGNVNLYTGYGGYSRSALVMPVFLEKTGPGHLVVEIRAGEETAATIEVPLAHAGWQKLVYHYSWNSGMKWVKNNLRDKLDNIRVSAHGTQNVSTACFDALFYNDPRDFRDANHSIREHWQPETHDFSKLPVPSAADLTKVDQLVSLMETAVNPGLTRPHWEKRIAQIGEQIRQNGYHKGKPVTKGLAEYFGFLNTIAEEWLRCADPEMKRALAGHFHTVNDWLQEQGLVVNGALGKQNNYVGRTYVDAVTKMRKPLLEHGTLEASVNYLKWSYDYDKRVFGQQHGESMDYFHNEATRLLRIAMAHGDATERWHHVSRFRETLGKQLAESIKPDGAIFHHGFHYFAYGSMGMNSISGTLAVMSQAGLPVSRDGLDAVRTALESMIWYCGRTTLWSLVGRNPAGNQNLPSGAIYNLARAYADHPGGKPDRGLLAEYLRFEPQRAKEKEFEGITPAANPQGHRTMPYAALGMHRRGHWLAGVKGYSKYAASGESYANANRHGLFLSMGQLELLTHPAPLPTVHGSGTRPDEGYNWCAIEGATTIHSPLDRIANGNGTRIPFSGETFVGGLSNGTNGVFTMTYRNGFTDWIMRDRAKDAPKPEPLTGLKSWFFFDNRIVCLGSGISTNNVTWPVRTTLFQKYLTPESGVTRFNGESLALQGEGITRNANGATLVDPYGNAYFTPPGTPVSLTISTQTSRNGGDNADTKGNYSTAWIEHGTNPQCAAYEYTVLVQPTPEELAAFQPEKSHTIIRKDAGAHIVRDHATRTTGYAVFDAKTALPDNTLLASVAQPCLVMLADQDGGKLRLSLTNPDVRPTEKSAASITVSLRGDFSPHGDTKATVTTANGRTTVTVPVFHGESVNLQLKKSGK